jgi:hypothetical protein
MSVGVHLGLNQSSRLASAVSRLGFGAPSRSVFFTHSCSVYAVQPILAAIDETAAQREACSPS